LKGDTVGRLTDKVAIVTGGASGMGEAIAMLFAREGAVVVVADIEKAKADLLIEDIRVSSGRRALALATNVAEELEVKAMVQTVLDEFGTIDLLINCVGVAEYVPAEEITSQQWLRIMSVDLNGVFYCCRDVGREMIKRKRGKIVNFASTAGLAGTPYMCHYAAAKHGVVGLTKSLAVEWGKHNIHVNCICPGATLTPMLLGATTEQYRLDRARRIPLNRLARPEDQANVALFLASTESDHVSGAVICVDGGMYAMASSTSDAALRGEK
jgi:NAD(P)-dependent dehydrogenase (short-subunit alcohol dehydrogenase family)